MTYRPTPSGTGVDKIVSGVEQTPASLVVNDDVDAAAAIDQSKIAGLSTSLSSKANTDLDNLVAPTAIGVDLLPTGAPAPSVGGTSAGQQWTAVQAEKLNAPRSGLTISTTNDGASASVVDMSISILTNASGPVVSELISGDISLTTQETQAVNSVSGSIYLDTGNSTGEGGGIYLDTGDGATLSGEVSIGTGNSSGGASGDITLLTGSGATESGGIDIDTGGSNSAMISGDVRIRTGNTDDVSGNILVSTGSGLNTSGTLTLGTGSAISDITGVSGSVILSAGSVDPARAAFRGNVQLIGQSVELGTAGDPLTGPLQVNGTVGAAGEALVSQGAGLPPTWAAISTTPTLDVVYLNAASQNDNLITTDATRGSVWVDGSAVTNKPAVRITNNDVGTFTPSGASPLASLEYLGLEIVNVTAPTPRCNSPLIYIAGTEIDEEVGEVETGYFLQSRPLGNSNGESAFVFSMVEGLNGTGPYTVTDIFSVGPNGATLNGASVATSATAIGGTIAATEIAYGTGSNTIGGDARFYWDALQGILAVLKTASPVDPFFTVNSTASTVVVNDSATPAWTALYPNKVRVGRYDLTAAVVDLTVENGVASLDSTNAGAGDFDLVINELRINGAPGAAGQVLTSNGVGAPPTWQAAAGGGVTSVTASAPLASSGGATPDISLAYGASGAGGAAFGGFTLQTANYSLTATDYFVNCTTNSFTVTLPTAVGAAGRVYVVKNSGSGTTITINTTGGETIDGAGSVPISTQYASFNFISDGANWLVF